MRIAEAMQVFGLENAHGISQFEMEKMYRRLAKENHPDKGGDTLKMQMIVDAWETFKEAYKKDSHWFEWAAAKEKADYDVVEKFRDILSKVQHLEGLILEINGSWLWVRGDTKTHKATLKENGFRFNRKKCEWSWHPTSENDTGKKKWYGKTKTREEIRARYGSQIVSQKFRAARIQ